MMVTATNVQQQADHAVRQVLQTQYTGEPAVIVDSPPGAGKTRLVEDLAALIQEELSQRCMIATMTNEQSFALVSRLGHSFSQIPIYLYTRRGLRVPSYCNFTRDVGLSNTLENGMSTRICQPRSK